MPSLRLYFTRRFLIARTAGVGSGMCVMARASRRTSPRPAALGTGAPSVRSKTLGGSDGRLVPGEEGVVRRRRRSEEVLERVLVAAEQALATCRVARSKRSRNGRSPSGDAPCAAQEDRVAVLAHHPLAVRQHRVDRPARILVVLVARQVPEQPRLRLRDRRRRRRTSGASAGSRRTPGAARCRAARSSRSRRSAARCARSRRAAPVNGAFCIITLSRAGTFDVPVAAVERLGPDQRGRLGRAPGEVARAGRHAVRSARGRRSAASRARRDASPARSHTSTSCAKRP